MQFFDLPYLLASAGVITVVAIVLYRLLAPRRRRELAGLDTGDCRETRLIEQGESLRRECED